MKIADCTFEQAPEVLEIFNDAILHSTALYDYKPRTMSDMEVWFSAKQESGHSVIGLFEEDGSLSGFASYGVFRAWPAYKYSVEHSVYIHTSQRGRGFGNSLLSELIKVAESNHLHMMIGGIDSTNLASIKLHQRLGFSHCASIKQAGYKFGRWLDLEFYQLLLPTPEAPNEE